MNLTNKYACMKLKGHHFEHLVNYSGYFQNQCPAQLALLGASHQQFTKENKLRFASFLLLPKPSGGQIHGQLSTNCSSIIASHNLHGRRLA